MPVGRVGRVLIHVLDDHPPALAQGARACSLVLAGDRAQGGQEFLGQPAVGDDFKHVPSRVVELNVPLIGSEQQHGRVEDFVQVRHQFGGNGPPRKRNADVGCFGGLGLVGDHRGPGYFAPV